MKPILDRTKSKAEAYAPGAAPKGTFPSPLSFRLFSWNFRDCLLWKALRQSAAVQGDDVRFSNRPVGVKRFLAVSDWGAMSLAGSCFSPESAPRPFHHGIREQGGTIFWAALPVVAGRSKRTCELTLSIVPQGTPFHH